jgi:hypothetical protein
LSSDAILDAKMIDVMCVLVENSWQDTLLIVRDRLLSGYSRFPVHEPGDPLAFSGLLLIKKVWTCLIPFCFGVKLTVFR